MKKIARELPDSVLIPRLYTNNDELVLTLRQQWCSDSSLISSIKVMEIDLMRADLLTSWCQYAVDRYEYDLSISSSSSAAATSSSSSSSSSLEEIAQNKGQEAFKIYNTITTSIEESLSNSSIVQSDVKRLTQGNYCY